MCTLILAWRVFDGTPVAAAANRDESFGRPSSPPSVSKPNDGPLVLAPRDERAGGTWIGYNEHGVFAAITNRWVAPVADGERSRGLLVDDALSEPSAGAASTRVKQELERRSYDPFHLILADENDCVLIEWDDVFHVRELQPGVHIVVNVGADGDWFVPASRPDAGREQAANAERVRAELQPTVGETAADWVHRAGDVLGDHEFGVCVHRNGFGTRSSSLVRLGAERVFEFAAGPPCEHTHERVEGTI